MSAAANFKALLGRLAAGERLSEAEATDAFDAMMSGDATPSQIGAFLMAATQVPGIAQDIEAGQRPGGDDRRQGGGEDEAGGIGPNRIDELGVASDIAAHDAKGLAERAFDDVDFTHDTVAFGDAGAAIAVQADGMDFVDIGQAAVFPGERHRAADVGDVAVHRIDRLKRDQLRRIDRCRLEQLFQVRKVVMAIDVANPSTVPDAFDH